MTIRMCPSILNADRGNILNEIRRIAPTSDFLHLDVMDGVFVPNTSFTDQECAKIIENSPLLVDCHLMINDPDERAIEYAQMGAHSITFHLEASSQPHMTLQTLGEYGVRRSLAIKPKTEFKGVIPYLDSLDMLLIMTVEPGFGGQTFMMDMLPKIKAARDYFDMHALNIWLEVDGGISIETIRHAFGSGADTFVAGSAVFKDSDPESMVSRIRQAASLK